jgi:hypothetical protein
MRKSASPLRIVERECQSPQESGRIFTLRNQKTLP